VTTLDPSRSEEVAHLGRRFSSQDASSSSCCARRSSRHGRTRAPEAEVERVLGILRHAGGRLGPRTAAESWRAYEQRFGQGVR
jgi:hypothetical protein